MSQHECILILNTVNKKGPTMKKKVYVSILDETIYSKCSHTFIPLVKLYPAYQHKHKRHSLISYTTKNNK